MYHYIAIIILSEIIQVILILFLVAVGATFFVWLEILFELIVGITSISCSVGIPCNKLF